MSHTAINLTIHNKEEQSQEVTVTGSRFTIGRDADNDLTINDAELARRHALIENFDGLVQLCDCGSDSGIMINGRQITGVATLKNGDRISLGKACEIIVNINPAKRESEGVRLPDRKRSDAPRQLQSQTTTRFTTPVIAAMAVAAIMIVTLSLAAIFKGAGRGQSIRNSRQEEFPDSKNTNGRISQPPVDDSKSGAGRDLDKGKVTIEQIEKAAEQVLRRVSSDNRPYVFPPYAVKALDDIRTRVEEYRSSPALVRTLSKLAAEAPDTAARARREGIEPDLVIYAALAETDGGRNNETPLAIAQAILPDLLALRKTLGTESADKSLIIIAAYKMGRGTKKSHPLLQTIRRLVKNPLTDRNVWYLHERGGLDEQAYRFLIDFLALGIIAQNPPQFGVKAPSFAL
jgi:pSer/pThr/pTyr-binding forkhead associated (FHA) protein